MRPARRRAQELRQAIDCLPVRTREAMLEGIAANEIIVGAYTDHDGRVCPMLAAHRHGGRTSLASFARAWDRYTHAKRPRPATPRELRTLTAMLEASLFYSETDLETAAAEHRELTRERPRPDTGERTRLKELRDRVGWAWTRVFRRYDDYQATLARLEEAESRKQKAQSPERELVG